MSFSLWSSWLGLTLLVALGAKFLRRSLAVVLGIVAVACWIVAAFLLTDLSLSTQALVATSGAGLLSALVYLASGHIGDRVEAVTEVEVESGVDASSGESEEARNHAVARIPHAFDEWLASHRDLADPWPDFGEFVRASLLACCGAVQIKAYRLLSPDDITLLPLHETSPNEKDFPPLRSGIRGHVATSGSSYYANESKDDAVHALANLGGESCVWSFPVHVHRNLIGVIQVGELPCAELSSKAHLQLVEGVIVLCWGALTEACRSRIADHTDSVAGVLTPEAFLSLAGRTLKDAYTKNEPLAVVSFNIEGLRALTDHGHWEVAKDAVRRASEIIRERIREDDCAGFFDGSRFVVLLCRVDAELARLIVSKIQDYIRSVFVSLGSPEDRLDIRCGVVVTGDSSPSLHSLISQASSVCTSARKQGIDLFVRVDAPDEAVTA